MANTETGYSVPHRFRANLTPGVVHPLDGMPLEVVSQVQHMVSVPINYKLDEFTNYMGPTAEGSQNGYELVGTTGTATVAVSGGTAHGNITVSTSGVEDDNFVFRLDDFVINYSTTLDTWLGTRFAVSDANDMEVFWGLTTTTNDFVASLPVSGIFFSKAETDTTWTFNSRRLNVSTVDSTSFANVTIADFAQQVLLIRIHLGNITPYIYDITAGTWTVGNTIPSTDPNVPPDSVALRWHLAAETGAASAASTFVDFLLLAQVR